MTSDASQAESDREELPVFWVALQKKGLVLPEVTVAEIIAYEPLQRLEDTPDWCLGLLGWRGRQVPVVSFEMLTVERASFSLVSVSSASLVILRGLNDADELPFYALVAQTPPRHLLLTPEMLIETGEEAGRTELARVRFENDLVSIPDLDYVEACLRNVLIT